MGVNPGESDVSLLTFWPGGDTYIIILPTCTFCFKQFKLKVTACTFRGVSSLTDVAHALYIADILTPYQIKAYKICYKKIAILFDSNESASFLRPIYEGVMIAFHEL